MMIGAVIGCCLNPPIYRFWVGPGKIILTKKSLGPLKNSQIFPPPAAFLPASSLFPSGSWTPLPGGVVKEGPDPNKTMICIFASIFFSAPGKILSHQPAAIHLPPPPPHHFRIFFSGEASIWFGHPFSGFKFLTHLHCQNYLFFSLSFIVQGRCSEKCC